jgi:hypothetical protein
MANWFEDVTKTLADEKIGRRTALRRVAGTVAGTALASAIPGIALAKKSQACPAGGGNCTIGFVNCKNNPNTNCLCFSATKGKAGHCGCNSYCSQIPSCTKNSDCAKSAFCSTLNGCTGCGSSSGVCIPKCAGKNKNCQLGSGHGTTAAR